jgi:hypothetical protein
VRDDKAAGDSRQIRCNILSESIRKITLLGIVAEVSEGQDHDRQTRLGGRGRRHDLRYNRRILVEMQAEAANRSCDVLDLLLAQVHESGTYWIKGGRDGHRMIMNAIERLQATKPADGEKVH